MLKQGIDQMLTISVIEPAHTDWVSPIVLVSEKDGSLRFNVDYRKLNAVKIWDSYLILRLDECIDSVGVVTAFSTVNMNRGLRPVEIAQNDRD